MTEKEHLAKLVEKTKKWIVYWYDTQEWHELNLTDPAFYAEHLYKADIECILVPKKCYDDPKLKKYLDEMIEDEICILPGKSLN